jgi:hypothetical protein
VSLRPPEIEVGRRVGDLDHDAGIKIVNPQRTL